MIIPCPLEELPRHERLRDVTRALARHPLLNGNPAKDTPLHTLMGWSKFEVLLRAIELDPFGASHFIWLDFGLAHTARIGHVGEDRVFADAPDEARILQMRPLDPSLLLERSHHLQYRRGHFASGLISGRADRLRQLCRLVASETEAVLDEGFAPLDEQLLELAIAAEPELFSLHHGDYEFILENYRRLRGSAET